MNLLSISQICDQDFMVLFSKGKCLVLNESGKQLISGIRTLDNCYGLVHGVANVLYVEGLRVNLLSISQICNQDFMVLFLKEKCLVLNESGKQLISGIRTLDNCYGLVLDTEIVCNNI